MAKANVLPGTWHVPRFEPPPPWYIPRFDRPGEERSPQQDQSDTWFVPRFDQLDERQLAARKPPERAYDPAVPPRYAAWWRLRAFLCEVLPHEALLALLDDIHDELAEYLRPPPLPSTPPTMALDAALRPDLCRKVGAFVERAMQLGGVDVSLEHQDELERALDAIEEAPSRGRPPHAPTTKTVRTESLLRGMLDRGELDRGMRHAEAIDLARRVAQFHEINPSVSVSERAWRAARRR